MLQLPLALSALDNFHQFIVYELAENTERLGKTDKKPINPHTGRKSNPTDPGVWSDFKTASDTAHRLGDSHGVGFVLTEDDPFFFIDLDDCLDQSTNTWNPTALNFMLALSGAAVEISSSRKGLHIIGVTSDIDHRCKDKSMPGLEMYTSGRFVALTGTNAIGNVWTDCTQSLRPIVDQFFPPRFYRDQINFNWSSEADADWAGPIDDTELLRRALNSKGSKQVFNNYASFKDLWESNTDALCNTYPDSDGDSGYDESAADLALASHLAFWTGKNCNRIYGLMLQSNLTREKWNRKKYLENTILFACNTTTSVLKDLPPAQLVPPALKDQTTPEFQNITGSTFLTPEQQQELFKGCVYIEDFDGILTPGGKLLNHGQFKRRYGGYTMLMDTKNVLIRRDAFEVFTESQAFRAPRADTVCFRPDITPASIIVEAGITMANVFWPPAVKKLKGNVDLFVNHLHELLPVQRDVDILLSYIAACVQFQGKKFTWCPLIQGVQGCGKTLIGDCTAEAIGRQYVTTPRAEDIKNRFNSWMYGNILAVANEIFLNDSYENISILNNLITEDYQEVEPKGKDQKSRRVCCNFILSSNFKNAVKKTKNDRRFAVFYTAIQSSDDLHLGGLSSRAITLQNWLREKNGYAIVSEFLHTYKILDEFNPLLVRNAPTTSSTNMAITESKNYIEQEIQEAVGQGMIGFRNGWISSYFLDNLLRQIQSKNKVPYNRRKDMLNDLGYIWHPGLIDGRTTSIVMPDGVKPKLFIKQNHHSISLTNPLDIAKEYTKDQNIA